MYCKRSLQTALLVVFALTTVAAYAQETRLQSPLSIPFELYHNRVYLPVKVNAAGPFTFVLDSGASLSGIDKGRALELHLPYKEGASLLGNGEAAMRVGLAANVILSVANLDLPQKHLVVLPFTEIERFEGRAIDGVLGVDLFRKYVVEIDYANRRLTLYGPGTYRYSGSGEIVPLRFSGNAALFDAKVEVAPGKTLDARLAIDQGTYSALRLYKPFVDQHNLLTLIRTAGGFGFGLGGEFAEAQGRVNALRLGNLSIGSPLTGFSQASGGATATKAYDGTIGGEILRRFKVIFDYPHSRAVFEPNAAFQDPFAADTSGLILIAADTRLGEITVHRVLPGSPAAAAQLESGDIIKTIDGKPAAELGLQGVRELFQRPGTFHLEVTRSDRTIPSELRTTNRF